MNRLALVEDDAEALCNHLAVAAPREEGAFCLLRQGRGREGVRLLASEPILPPPDAWERQGNDLLRPSARWISSAVSRAVTADAGLLFVHSHPDSHFPPGLSQTDRESFTALATTLAPMLDGPFAAAVVHPTGWAGVVWDDGQVVPIDRIVRVGRTLGFLSATPTAEPQPLDGQQRDALGGTHDRVRALHIGVVGCGGLGSPMAEQLARMGVARVLLIDHDRLDTDSNVRRVFGSTVADLRATQPPLKVDVVGRHLDQLGFNTTVERLDADVRTEAALRALLDMDVVLCGTDTHGSRAMLNALASTYLLPVIDVGVRVGNKQSGALAGLLAEVRVLTPTTPCLWCRGTLNGHVIREENLPEPERQQLEREGYAVGRVGQPAPSVVALTVLGSGLGTCALLALLSDDAREAPTGYWVDGFFGDAAETSPQVPRSDCLCRDKLARGDSAPPPVLTA